MAIACIYLGNVEANRQVGGGIPYYEQSLALYRELGDTWGVAYALNNLGLSAFAVQQDHARARALYEESLRLRRALRDGHGIVMTLNNLAILARDEENYAEARSRLEEGVAILRESGDRYDVASLLLSLSHIVHLQDDYTAALPLAEEGVALCRENADIVALYSALNLLGRILHSRGELARAQAALEEQLALAKEQKSQPCVVQSLVGLSVFLTERGDYLSARAYLRQGFQAVQEGMEDAEWHTLTVLIQGVATYATAQGQPEVAVRLLGAVSALWEQMRARLHRRDRAEFQARLAPLREALGEVAFTTAWEAGRALDREQALALARDTLQ
jgi:tetratricopeptide (TPR) repeat protein